MMMTLYAGVFCTESCLFYANSAGYGQTKRETQSLVPHCHVQRHFSSVNPDADHYRAEGATASAMHRNISP